MKNMKRGYITQVLSQDNIIIIREDVTFIEYILFIDEISGKRRKLFTPNTQVYFSRRDSDDVFIATDVRPMPIQHLRCS